MNALDLHGSEINSNGVDDVLRDEEVAAFLIGMLEMKVCAGLSHRHLSYITCLPSFYALHWPSTLVGPVRGPNTMQYRL